jgi:septum formation protein
MDRRSAFPPDFELILASQSPRRHSLLRDVGVPFTVASSEGEEACDGATAESLAGGNARAKLEGVVLPEDARQGTFVLATDTVVAIGPRVMGKPSSERDAAEMLAVLSGRTHRVVSGVALGRLDRGSAVGDHVETARPMLSRVLVEVAVTEVTFAKLGGLDIEAYLASGEWHGKAGAYAIQGLAGMYVRSISGEYSNVVGLPLGLLGRMFVEMGFDLVRRQWV